MHAFGYDEKFFKECVGRFLYHKRNRDDKGFQGKIKTLTIDFRAKLIKATFEWSTFFDEDRKQWVAGENERHIGYTSLNPLVQQYGNSGSITISGDPQIVTILPPKHPLVIDRLAVRGNEERGHLLLRKIRERRELADEGS